MLNDVLHSRHEHLRPYGFPGSPIPLSYAISGAYVGVLKIKMGHMGFRVNVYTLVDELISSSRLKPLRYCSVGSFMKGFWKSWEGLPHLQLQT